MASLTDFSCAARNFSHGSRATRLPSVYRKRLSP
jgi:hypothetical protein